jgi:biopolymer transport protein ExbB/TolQ
MSEITPNSPADPKVKCCKNPWLTCLIVSIFGMIIPLLIGVSGTVFGMIKAFKSLNEGNPTDPSELADGISQSMIATSIGIVVSFVFLILFVISLVKVLSSRRRN